MISFLKPLLAVVVGGATSTGGILYAVKNKQNNLDSSKVTHSRNKRDISKSENKEKNYNFNGFKTNDLILKQINSFGSDMNSCSDTYKSGDRHFHINCRNIPEYMNKVLKEMKKYQKDFLKINNKDEIIKRNRDIHNSLYRENWTKDEQLLLEHCKEFEGRNSWNNLWKSFCSKENLDFFRD